MLLRGYSVQAAKHERPSRRRFYTHAEQEGWFSGPNQAKFVKLPEMERSTPHALSFQQVVTLLPQLAKVPRLMVFLAIITSMNVAEICGLRWTRLNLTAEPIIMDDELLPPFMAGVREQWYKGEWGSVKAKARRRYVPLPQWAVAELRELRQRDNWVGPEDPVFAGDSGKPLARTRSYSVTSSPPVGSWECHG